MNKICTKCGLEKPVDYFPIKKGKIFSWCYVCKKQADKDYRNSLEGKNKRTVWVCINKEKLKIYKSKHYEDNKEVYCKNNEQWKLNNVEKRKSINRNYQRRRRTNISYRLQQNVSCLIRTSVISGKQGKKTKHILQSLGYSIDELKKHLENLFQEGMSWENYGRFGWHIDHIMPICSFNINKLEDPSIKKLWGLQNLRPLWRKDNIKKAKKDKLLSIKNTRTL
jgi:hypothetical protein